MRKNGYSIGHRATNPVRLNQGSSGRECIFPFPRLSNKCLRGRSRLQWKFCRRRTGVAELKEDPKLALSGYELSHFSLSLPELFARIAERCCRMMMRLRLEQYGI